MAVIDERIVYYTRGENAFNFGDYLSDFFARHLLIEPIASADLFRLIGSAISAPLIESDLARIASENPRIVYWGCGARDDSPIPRDLLAACEFYGVRGPLTRQALDLPYDTVMGDPGLLFPLLHKARPSQTTSGKVACLPHFSQRHQVDSLLADVRADVALSPAVTSDEELLCLVDDIASADFLITGSLHGAIIAAAYGRPFAFWDTGFVDVPFKWKDFAASIGAELSFCRTVEEGRRSHEQWRDIVRLPDLAPILGCCPFAVRPSLLIGALARDMGVSASDSEKWISKARDLEHDDLSWGARHRAASAIKRESDRQRQLRSQGFEDGMVVAELGDLEHRVRALADDIASRAERLKIRLTADAPTLNFAAGTPGNRLLGEGWTSANEVAPWSLPPLARLRIPYSAGWARAVRIRLDGFLFAPRTTPSMGKREICIWLGDTLCWRSTITNDGPLHNCTVALEMDIPEQLRKLGGDLVVSIGLEDVGSNLTNGTGTDERPIGIAPLSLTFVFPPE